MLMEKTAAMQSILHGLVEHVMYAGILIHGQPNEDDRQSRPLRRKQAVHLASGVFKAMEDNLTRRTRRRA